jgi:CheY-specific phosphatase CheX
MFEEIRETAVSVASNVFETMLFTFIEPQDGGKKREPLALRSSSVLLMGEIGFSGKYSGVLKLTLPLGLAKKMASNFMGLEEESTDSHAVDLVNELCNMICGNLSCRLDRTLMWNLAIPKTRVISQQELEDGTSRPGITIDFDADGEWVNLSIQLSSATPVPAEPPS